MFTPTLQHLLKEPKHLLQVFSFYQKALSVAQGGNQPLTNTLRVFGKVAAFCRRLDYTYSRS